MAAGSLMGRTGRCTRRSSGTIGDGTAALAAGAAVAGCFSGMDGCTKIMRRAEPDGLRWISVRRYKRYGLGMNEGCSWRVGCCGWPLFFVENYGKI